VIPETPDLRVMSDNRDLWDRKDFLVRRVLLVRQDHRDHRDKMAILDLPDRLDCREVQDQLEPQVFRV
jgi:hypothetical protein